MDLLKLGELGDVRIVLFDGGDAAQECKLHLFLQRFISVDVVRNSFLSGLWMTERTVGN